MAINSLPAGFVLDQATSTQYDNSLPEGFVLDSTTSKPELPPQNKSAYPYRDMLGKGIRKIGRIAEGSGNLAIGATQFATDVIDPTGKSQFSQNLAKGVKERKEEQSKLPLSDRILLGIGEAAPLLPVAATGGLIKGGAIVGGAMGALSQQEEPGLEGRLKETAESAAVGAGAGAALKGIGAVAKPVIKGTSDLVRRLTKGQAGEDILGKMVKPEEAKRLANRLESSDSRQTLLPDIAGDEVAGLTRLLAKTPGSKNLINQALDSRTVTSSRRVANLINTKISPEAYFGSLDDLVKARAEVSAPLYKAAYEQGANIKKSPEVRAILKDDRVISALKTAKKDYGIEAPINSVESLHGARQVIDDIIQVARRQQESNKVRAYMELKNKLRKVMYDASPILKTADDTFSGFSALKGAQEEGLDFNRYRPEELKKFVSKLTPSEKDAFKIGVRENLMRSVDKTVDNTSSARRIFSKPENRQNLKVVFDSPSEYADFSKKMLDEIRLFNTKQRILGGSRTDINIADEGQIINRVAQGIVSPKFATVGVIADSLKKRYIGLNEKNAKDLAQILTSKQKSIDALRNIAKKTKDVKQKEIINSFIGDTVSPIIGLTVTKELTQE